MNKADCIFELKWLRGVYAGMRKEYGSCVEALDMAINALEQTAWIPCSERLPEATGVYIVTCNIYNGDKVDGVTATWSYWRRNEWMMKDVLAWMPLPKPYGGERDE